MDCCEAHCSSSCCSKTDVSRKRRSSLRSAGRYSMEGSGVEDKSSSGQKRKGKSECGSRDGDVRQHKKRKCLIPPDGDHPSHDKSECGAKKTFVERGSRQKFKIGESKCPEKSTVMISKWKSNKRNTDQSVAKQIWYSKGGSKSDFVQTQKKKVTIKKKLSKKAEVCNAIENVTELSQDEVKDKFKGHDPKSPEYEDLLWDLGIICTDTSVGLLNGVVYYNWKLFGHQTVHDHRNLCVCSFRTGSEMGMAFIKHPDNKCWHMKNQKKPARPVKIFQKQTDRHDAVSLYNKYLQYVPRVSSFYRQPIPGQAINFSMRTLHMQSLDEIHRGVTQAPWSLYAQSLLAKAASRVKSDSPQKSLKTKPTGKPKVVEGQTQDSTERVDEGDKDEDSTSDHKDDEPDCKDTCDEVLEKRSEVTDGMLFDVGLDVVKLFVEENPVSDLAEEERCTEESGKNDDEPGGKDKGGGDDKKTDEKPSVVEQLQESANMDTGEVPNTSSVPEKSRNIQNKTKLTKCALTAPSTQHPPASYPPHTRGRPTVAQLLYPNSTPPRAPVPNNELDCDPDIIFVKTINGIDGYQCAWCARVSFQVPHVLLYSPFEVALQHLRLQHHKHEFVAVLVNRSSGFHYYRCCHCPFQTSRHKLVAAHVALKHPEASQIQHRKKPMKLSSCKDAIKIFRPNGEICYKCRLCSYESNSVMGISYHCNKMHRARQEVNAPFKCWSCPFTAEKNADFLRHVQHCHSSVPAKDEVVSTAKGVGFMTVKTKSNLTEYTCFRCPYKTEKLMSITYHVKKNHQKASVFKCKLCQFATGTRSALETHYLELHAGVIPCSQNFLENIGPSVDQSSEDDSFSILHGCKLCVLMFRSMDDCINHIQRSHASFASAPLNCYKTVKVPRICIPKEPVEKTQEVSVVNPHATASSEERQTSPNIPVVTTTPDSDIDAEDVPFNLMLNQLVDSVFPSTSDQPLPVDSTPVSQPVPSLPAQSPSCAAVTADTALPAAILQANSNCGSDVHTDGIPQGVVKHTASSNDIVPPCNESLAGSEIHNLDDKGAQIKQGPKVAEVSPVKQSQKQELTGEENTHDNHSDDIAGSCPHTKEGLGCDRNEHPSDHHKTSENIAVSTAASDRPQITGHRSTSEMTDRVKLQFDLSVFFEKVAYKWYLADPPVYRCKSAQCNFLSCDGNELADHAGKHLKLNGPLTCQYGPSDQFTIEGDVHTFCEESGSGGDVIFRCRLCGCPRMATAELVQHLQNCHRTHFEKTAGRKNTLEKKQMTAPNSRKSKTKKASSKELIKEDVTMTEAEIRDHFLCVLNQSTVAVESACLFQHCTFMGSEINELKNHLENHISRRILLSEEEDMESSEGNTATKLTKEEVLQEFVSMEVNGRKLWICKDQSCGYFSPAGGAFIHQAADHIGGHRRTNVSLQCQVVDTCESDRDVMVPERSAAGYTCQSMTLSEFKTNVVWCGEALIFQEDQLQSSYWLPLFECREFCGYQGSVKECTALVNHCASHRGGKRKLILVEGDSEARGDPGITHTEGSLDATCPSRHPGQSRDPNQDCDASKETNDGEHDFIKGRDTDDNQCTDRDQHCDETDGLKNPTIVEEDCEVKTEEGDKEDTTVCMPLQEIIGHFHEEIVHISATSVSYGKPQYTCKKCDFQTFRAELLPAHLEYHLCNIKITAKRMAMTSKRTPRNCKESSKADRKPKAVNVKDFRVRQVKLKTDVMFRQVKLQKCKTEKKSRRKEENVKIRKSPRKRRAAEKEVVDDCKAEPSPKRIRKASKRKCETPKEETESKNVSHLLVRQDFLKAKSLLQIKVSDHKLDHYALTLSDCMEFFTEDVKIVEKGGRKIPYGKVRYKCKDCGDLVEAASDLPEHLQCHLETDKKLMLTNADKKLTNADCVKSSVTNRQTEVEVETNPEHSSEFLQSIAPLVGEIKASGDGDSVIRVDLKKCLEFFSEEMVTRDNSQHSICYGIIQYRCKGCDFKTMQAEAMPQHIQTFLNTKKKVILQGHKDTQPVRERTHRKKKSKAVMERSRRKTRKKVVLPRERSKPGK